VIKELPHPPAGPHLQEVGDVPLYGEHVLAHPVEHHHVERDAEHGEEHAEDLGGGGAGTHVAVTCTHWKMLVRHVAEPEGK